MSTRSSAVIAVASAPSLKLPAPQRGTDDAGDGDSCPACPAHTCSPCLSSHPVPGRQRPHTGTARPRPGWSKCAAYPHNSSNADHFPRALGARDPARTGQGDERADASTPPHRGPCPSQVETRRGWVPACLEGEAPPRQEKHPNRGVKHAHLWAGRQQRDRGDHRATARSTAGQRSRVTEDGSPGGLRGQQPQPLETEAGGPREAGAGRGAGAQSSDPAGSSVLSCPNTRCWGTAPQRGLPRSFLLYRWTHT